MYPTALLPRGDHLAIKLKYNHLQFNIMGGSDDSDDDVPVSRLRGQRGDPPHSAAYRDSRKRTSEASDPSRAEKQPAVGYTAAKAGAELVAAELKRAQQLRDGAPASRQCADYVLERIRAVPEHAWFAEPARRPRASNSGPPRAVPPGGSRARRVPRLPGRHPTSHGPAGDPAGPRRPAPRPKLDAGRAGRARPPGATTRPDPSTPRSCATCGASSTTPRRTTTTPTTRGDQRRARARAPRRAAARAQVVHLGAKRCLEALEIALGTASDALAAATGAGEARDDAARRRACAAALRGEAPDDGGGLARLRDRLQRLAAGAAAIPKKEAGGLWALLRDAEVRASPAGAPPRRASAGRGGGPAPGRARVEEARGPGAPLRRGCGRRRPRRGRPGRARRLQGAAPARRGRGPRAGAAAGRLGGEAAAQGRPAPQGRDGGRAHRRHARGPRGLRGIVRRRRRPRARDARTRRGAQVVRLRAATGAAARSTAEGRARAPRRRGAS